MDRTGRLHWSGDAQTKDFEREIKDKDILTNQDIQKYVTLILDEVRKKNVVEEGKKLFDKICNVFFKNLSKKNGSEAFLIPEIDEDTLFDQYNELETGHGFYSDSPDDRKIIEAVKERLQRQIREEFLNQLAVRSDITNLVAGDINLVEPGRTVIDSRTNKPRSSFRKTVDIYGNEKILRDSSSGLPEDFAKSKDQVRQNNAKERGHRLLAQLSPHEHIVNIYGANNEHILVKKEENLQNLEQNRLSLQESVSVIVDCLDGASFLVKNGLVLQDISLPNIGYVVDQNGKKKGRLFDLEVVVPLGTPATTLTQTFGYLLPPWLIEENKNKNSEAFMVYAFGMCLAFLVRRSSPSLMVQDQLLSLVQRMTRPYKNMPEQRPTLLQAREELLRIFSSKKDVVI